MLLILDGSLAVNVLSVTDFQGMKTLGMSVSINARQLPPLAPGISFAVEETGQPNTLVEERSYIPESDNKLLMKAKVRSQKILPLPSHNSRF